MGQIIVNRRQFAALVISGGVALTPSQAQEKTLQISESDLRKAAIVKIEPEYPAVARQIRLTGEVELEITVDISGSVNKVTVHSGNTLLVGPSVQAVKRWKFAQFHADGQPARAVGPIRFSFQI